MSAETDMSTSMFRGAGDSLPTVQGTPPGKTLGLRRQGSITPLHKFVEAKVQINDIFQNIETYVAETVDFLKEISKKSDVVTPSSINEMESFRDSVKTIKSVLARDKMKVVFFGRTSNGKSTAINAMLHSKVLPSGIGHTTRCFLQVEGSSTDDKYILTEGSAEQKSLQQAWPVVLPVVSPTYKLHGSVQMSIDSLSNALCSKEMGEDALVRVMWPRLDSRLLKNEVVLLDSPGVDVSPQFDSWIDKHCLDADVFVLVSNAESTLTQTEKNFFHRVNLKLSKPNLFILNNRWDASAAEPEYTEQVREQHMKQFLRFMVDELGVCTEEEAKHRVFFVSAREVLLNRLKNKGIACSPANPHFAEGFQARMLEFEDFERQFELCISQSAIETKFESHIEKGKRITSAVYDILDGLHTTLTQQRERVVKQHNEKLTELQTSQTACAKFISESKERNRSLAFDVKTHAFKEFIEEVKRLETIMDSFQSPFSDDAQYLITYKQNLISYIDVEMTRELHVRFTGGLLQRILDTEMTMSKTAKELLPATWGNKAISLLQFRQPFSFSFSVHFPSLIDDFREDLEFRFSFSVARLFRWLTQLKTGQNQLLGSSFLARPIAPAPDAEQGVVNSDAPTNDSIVVPTIVHTIASYAANGSITLVIIGGLVYRAVGWRVIIGAGALYGLLYAYERASWNNRAKEQALKKQMRRHLAGKLSQVSHSVVLSCENQVSREVDEVLGSLQRCAFDAHQEMKTEVDQFQKEVTDFDKIGKQFWQTKGKATALETQLADFLVDHLQKDVP